MKIRKMLAVTITLVTLTACSSTPPPFSYNKVPSKPLSKSEQATANAYLSVYEQWKGVPYHFGGTSFRGIDCSAFVQIAVQNATQQALPRTTKDQSKQGVEIAYEQARSGDLVFFKTSPKVRHVGVYLGNKQFLHASTSKGVIISRLDNPYWASKFWHFRRI
ncbi:C40 family peptidase [Vibrio cyclitrophicus]|uniref:C40 family peptidase n=1 Tax=Vibrio cyclitrophicus TaxID=47951 RepID=UPI000318C5BC|nr:NlpC/P60 family protein [Vibrio cyclitrophicus]KNH12827.1 hydrolase [Vibrio lentus]ERM60816.1 Lipoprotein NlpC [Vibrio cyclitrophicus FF75]OBS95221.1 hydrolase [Vibrio cyclitrophicus]OBT04577.1 hydrolase [Vibrio cyclitrophicus]OED71724.1 hydrolase [Vibrio cyclitrophicus ZF99]